MRVIFFKVRASLRAWKLSLWSSTPDCPATMTFEVGIEPSETIVRDAAVIEMVCNCTPVEGVEESDTEEFTPTPFTPAAGIEDVDATVALESTSAYKSKKSEAKRS